MRWNPKLQAKIILPTLKLHFLVFITALEAHIRFYESDPESRDVQITGQFVELSDKEEAI